MAVQDLSFHAGHRERLRQKFLEDKLTDVELLETLLSYAIPRRDVRPLARALFKEFGNVSQILTASMDRLVALPGMGQNTAIFIKLIHQILLNGYKAHMKDCRVLHDSEVLTNYLKMLMADKPIEEVHVLYLDSKSRLVHESVHSIGTLDHTFIYPREIMREALNHKASSVVLVHNHPVSDRQFSSGDIESTQEVMNVLSGVGIKLIDHYVFVDGILYSAKNMQLLNQGLK